MKTYTKRTAARPAKAARRTLPERAGAPAVKTGVVGTTLDALGAAVPDGLGAVVTAGLDGYGVTTELRVIGAFGTTGVELDGQALTVTVTTAGPVAMEWLAAGAVP